MKLDLYQIDAFTSQLFKGNPAAVIPLCQWLSTELMQAIAAENNLSETVFFVPSGDVFEIRWFTPEVEVNLCGHATLAASYYLFHIAGYEKDEILFQSQSGLLKVSRSGNNLLLDFPRWKPEVYAEDVDAVIKGLGLQSVIAVYKHRDLMIEVADEKEVINCNPDFTALKQSGFKIILTAKGTQVDFVSRFFAPAAGIDEDPVTGSAHSQLIPYWSEKLNKTKMNATQVSKRGGDLYCEDSGERVVIGGQCCFYMQGQISIPE